MDSLITGKAVAMCVMVKSVVHKEVALENT